MAKTWDTRALNKILVVVVGAKHLQSSTKPYVQLSLTKEQTFKTKKDKQARWNEFFLFELATVTSTAILKVSVFDVPPKRKSKKSFGTVEIPISSLPEEDFSDDSWELDSHDGGEVQLLIYRTCFRENEHTSNLTDFSYHYQNILLKTGDLILYSGAGPLGCFAKFSTKSHYTHAGLVVNLPNKYTRKIQPFIFELTRNLDDFPDAFAGRPTHNLPMLFRFEERIHGFNGTQIWLLPIKKALEPEDENRLSTWILELQREYVSFYATESRMKSYEKPPSELDITFSSFDWPAYLSELLEPFGIQPKVRRTHSELFSTELVCVALKKAYRDVLATSTHTGAPTPPHLLKSGHFDNPILLRCHASHSHLVNAEDEELPLPPLPPSSNSFREPPLPPLPPPDDDDDDDMPLPPVPGVPEDDDELLPPLPAIEQEPPIPPPAQEKILSPLDILPPTSQNPPEIADIPPPVTQNTPHIPPPLATSIDCSSPPPNDIIPPPPSHEPKLPAGWVSKIDANTNQPYYICIHTRKTQWIRPICPSVPTDLPPNWISKVDPSTGRTFYMNIIERKTTWEKPT